MKHLILFENFADLKIGDMTNLGVIEDKTATQVYCGGMWAHHSLVHAVAAPVKEKLKNRGKINPHMVISGFANAIEPEKVEEYIQVMAEDGMSNSFPPIKGYPTIISKYEINEFGQFLSGEPITKAHIGKYAWITTDGHHRTLAALETNLPILHTRIDFAYTGDANDYEQ